MRLLGRLIAVAALVPWLTVSAALPPEHVHESDAADHHHAPVVHRHLAPHDHNLSDVSHLDHDGSEVEDPDERVVWVNEVGIAEAVRSFPVVLGVVATHLAIAPEPVVHMAVAADEATLPHGPPRASASLRAPPSVLPLM